MADLSKLPRWAGSSRYPVPAVFITGARVARPEDASRWPASLRTTQPTAFVRLADLGCSPDLRRRCEFGEAHRGLKVSFDGSRDPPGRVATERQRGVSAEAGRPPLTGGENAAGRGLWPPP